MWHERTVGIEQVAYRAEWFSAGERAALGSSRGRFAARLLAKHLLAEHDGGSGDYSRIHIESRDGRDRSTRPQAYIGGRCVPWSISLSHSDRFVAAAIVPACHGRIGIDLVDPATLSIRRLRYWLTGDENQRAADRLAMGMIWSLKEAIYKASNEGTLFFPRHVDTAAYVSAPEWSRLERDVRIQGRATGSMSDGGKLSLNVIDGTIKTLVWRPAVRRLRRVPA